MADGKPPVSYAGDRGFDSLTRYMDNIVKKLKPLEQKEYILTDQCFWETNPPKDYNPLDPKRKPHAITLVDPETGSISILQSGSIIKVVKVRE